VTFGGRLKVDDAELAGAALDDEIAGWAPEDELAEAADGFLLSLHAARASTMPTAAAMPRSKGRAEAREEGDGGCMESLPCVGATGLETERPILTRAFPSVFAPILTVGASGSSDAKPEPCPFRPN